jgi:hypothetical protein
MQKQLNGMVDAIAFKNPSLIVQIQKQAKL